MRYNITFLGYWCVNICCYFRAILRFDMTITGLLTCKYDITSSGPSCSKLKKSIVNETHNENFALNYWVMVTCSEIIIQYEMSISGPLYKYDMTISELLCKY